MPTRLVQVLLVAFFLLLVGVASTVAVSGSGYFLTPAIARLDHPLDDWLRSGATGGLWLGLIGTTLMVSMLSYTVRKFFLKWNFLGNPTHWLHFHIICGIMGPVFILLHTAFVPPHGLIGIGFWCMILVALSGVFGRYVYGHFPRTAAGRSQDFGEAHEALMTLKAEVVAASPNAKGDALGAALALARDLDQEAHSILDWIRLDMEVRRRRDLIPAHLARAGLEGPQRKEVSSRLVAQLLAKRDLEAWSVTSKLFQWWHLFHEPLAKAMYIIVALHVLQAVVIGGALTRLVP